MPPINLLTTIRVDWFSNPMFYKLHSRETKNVVLRKAKPVDIKKFIELRKRG